MGIPEGRGKIVRWVVPIWVKKITVPIKINGPDRNILFLGQI
jgi:hypothetical protein